MKHLYRLVALGLTALPLALFGQGADGRVSKPKFAPTPENSLLDGKTIVKINAFNLVFGTPNLGLERILAPGASATLSLSYRPASNAKVYELDHRSSYYWSKLSSVGFYHITPALRWYLNGGQGHGFYFEGYYDLTHLMPADSYEQVRTPLLSGVATTAELKTRERLTAHTFGVSIGAQWLFGRKKTIVLDWCILGAGSGVARYSADGWVSGVAGSERVTFSSSPDLLGKLRESTDLNDQTSQVKLSEGDTRAHISGSSSKAYSYRMGLSIGFRF